MARPRSVIERKSINTTIEKELLNLLKELNIKTGIPINRLIEDAIKDKYLKNEK